MLTVEDLWQIQELLHNAGHYDLAAKVKQAWLDKIREETRS